MSPKLVAFFAVAMVFALVAGTSAEEGVAFAPVAPLTVPVESVLSRVARDAPKKCDDGKTLCVTACVKESGVYKCL